MKYNVYIINLDFKVESVIGENLSPAIAFLRMKNAEKRLKGAHYVDMFAVDSERDLELKATLK